MYYTIVDAKNPISPVQHSNQVLYFIKSILSTNHSTRLCFSEHFKSLTQYLFLIKYPSTNTRSVRKTSTETTKLDLSPSTSSYMTQTDPNNKINVIFPILVINLTRNTKDWNIYMHSLQTKMKKLVRKPKNRYSPCHYLSNIFNPNRMKGTRN